MGLYDILYYIFRSFYAVFIASTIVCSSRQVAGIITQPLYYFL